MGLEKKCALSGLPCTDNKMENPPIFLDCIWVFASHKKFVSAFIALGTWWSNVESDPKIHMNNML